MEISGSPKRYVWNGGNGTYKCGLEEVSGNPNQGGEDRAGGNECVAVEAVTGEMGWCSFKERGAKTV